jgi:hypothetical protein
VAETSRLCRCAVKAGWAGLAAKLSTCRNLPGLLWYALVSSGERAECGGDEECRREHRAREANAAADAEQSHWDVEPAIEANGQRPSVMTAERCARSAVTSLGSNSSSSGEPA